MKKSKSVFSIKVGFPHLLLVFAFRLYLMSCLAPSRNFPFAPSRNFPRAPSRSFFFLPFGPLLGLWIYQKYSIGHKI
ncbi:hypothetical protein A4A49_38985 [Nicotiana attenuata]|uniref:Uncharacterized protein n=1 Tax=Nicotiana attenuata TaxID=49451 RepID=A0A1J6JUA7_NICAT|nr:hypothetical protein A4A49_38985 [Nicotiana attenuata]